MSETLLIELLTEELPPKSLRALSEAFASEILERLKARGFLHETSETQVFATPRRLGVAISKVAAAQPEQKVSRKGPALKVALDADGKPAAALTGFAKSCGVTVDALTHDGNFFFFVSNRPGETLANVLPRVLAETLDQLPAPKLMRWGDRDDEFVRPVHGLVVMHGEKIIAAEIFGVTSGDTAQGHRFLGEGAIQLAHADDYQHALTTRGKVIANFDERRARISEQLRKAAGNATLALDDGLLDEITALTEYPVVYVGRFDQEFLTVPNECLMLAMRQHQRYVPLLEGGKLLPRFLIVANIETADPANIVSGNERVLRARLSDAKFFFDQDLKVRLEDRVPQLADVVYHRKLGTQLERAGRIEALTENIARMIGADNEAAKRAAYLCKADLTTGMVGEFPELQGIMGGHYARGDGEPGEVAGAIESHYRPRFSGDELPQSKTAISVALADKLEALAGLFGIGQQTTGDKDPFALRRHALGVVRILVERELQLPLAEFVKAAFAVFPGGMLGDAHTGLELFISERLRGYLRDQGYTANEVEAVLCRGAARLDLIPRQLAAVRAFAALPEAESLTAANKRVANILKQAETRKEKYNSVEAAMLKEPAERALFDALGKTSRQAALLFEQGDFTGYLKSFAVLKSPVDAFFDSVMVMVEDLELRKNRLALLADLRREMNRVADISKLAA